MWQPESGPVRPHPRARAAQLCAVLAAVVLGSGACTEDTLYPDDEVFGPGLTLAPHVVSVTATAPQTMEVTDIGQVEVKARTREGASPIAEIGATVLVKDTLGAVITAFPLERHAASPAIMPLPVPEALKDQEKLPLRVTFEVHAFALTASGVCVAAVESRNQQLPCGEFQGVRVAMDSTGTKITTGQQVRVALVPGRTVLIPGGATRIGDLVVDPRTRRAFLSNRTAHRVEVLEFGEDLGEMSFRDGVRVGAEPWGMALDTSGTQLIVANSGGINISFVDTESLAEDTRRRFQIPRVRLYQIREVVVDSASGQTASTLEYFTYADRPQFVAQDRRGRLLYSAISTEAAPIGTIRVADRQPGWSTWNARFLFAEGLLASTPPTSNRAIEAAGDDDFAIANVDSMTLEFIQSGPFAGATGRVTIFDHRPGTLPSDPAHLIRNAVPLPVADAIQDIWNQGSDVLAYPKHNWNVPETVQMADTTFVAVSEDHRFVAFAEGASAATGRVVIWGAAETGDGTLSRVDDVADILNNTSDQLTGIALNRDGTLGMARGKDATYFFGRDLRLQGLARSDAPGGIGAALRPNSSGSNPTLAFVGTGRNSVQIVETTHYRVVGEVPIRDAITGPLRVIAHGPGATPCPDSLSELAGATDSCVVARVFGVTSTSGVVAVDIFRKHLNGQLP